tara:strand:+ start:9101 stop:9526 length:426 start_codon:yes stop_codon:yes gene_type:complete
MIRQLLTLFATLFLSLSVFSGCGSSDDGPERYDVTGSITYKGAPLESGRITFVPDSEKGNQGPVGYAMVEAGKYDTRAPGGKGTISGAIQILITGDNLALSETGEIQPPLFVDHKETADIDPQQALTTLDFDVPAKTARKK